LEQVKQRGRAVGALKAVGLVDLDHRQPAPLSADVVSRMGEALFLLQEGAAGGQPLRTGGDLGQAHKVFLPVGEVNGRRPRSADELIASVDGMPNRLAAETSPYLLQHK